MSDLLGWLVFIGVLCVVGLVLGLSAWLIERKPQRDFNERWKAGKGFYG